MKIIADASVLKNVKADLLVVDMADDKKHENKALKDLDLQLKKEISTLIKKEKFKGAPGESKLIYTKGKLKSDYVLIVGLGPKNKFNLEVLRKAGAVILSVAQKIKAAKIVTTILGSDYSDHTDQVCAQAVAEGFLLAGYRFSKYLKKSEENNYTLVFSCGSRSNLTGVNKSLKVAEALCQGVSLARDLVNAPANEATPRFLATTAREIKGVQVRVHDLKAIKKMKMGAYLSVALGSTANPPYFIEMHYRPKTKAKKRIAFIGKGVTFDTGGYSIKPAKSMETMKDDMAGAAAVIGLMSIIARLNPKVEVSGYVAATENMVDGFAQRPGDICKSMSGKTIEVLNTDAEGRLTLADALTYALKKKPDYVIDAATLTGACLVALGLRCTGIMGNDQGLIERMIKTGEETGERLWQLPLIDEYRDELKSPIADLKNIGSAYAGTITAGLFLENFVGDAKWAHLDIAGPAWTDAPLPYIPRGGTGVMVRTFASFVCGF